MSRFSASIGTWLTFLTGTAALAASPNGPTTTGVSGQDQPELQEVVVTGLRASLEKSLDDKKNAPIVEDSIDAEELGRFPDSDVADSLEHLPGITITRTTGGEGQKVSVRGFGPQYNIVTLNNRILATDDDARDLAFDVLPSEVISAADVLKSTQASALEGSIGGTVNLRTASPFDSPPGWHGGAHVEGNYNDMSKLYGKKFSAFASDMMLDQTLGFLVGGVISNNHERTDSLNAYTQNIYGPTNYPFGDPNGEPLSSTPCCITFGSVFDDKKREALSGSLEWRPSDSFKLIADGLWTKLEDEQIGYNQSYYFATDPAGDNWSNPTINNGVVTGVTSGNFQPEIVNNTIDRNVVTSLYGLRGSWQATDRFKLDFDGYRSTASRPEGGADTFVTAGLVSDTPVAQDILVMQDLPHSLPSLNVLIPPSQLGMSACPGGTTSATNSAYCSYTALMNSGALNNNKYWSTHDDGFNGYSVHDQVTGFTLDGDFQTHRGFWDKLLFGAGYNHREKSRVDESNDWTNGSGQYGTLYNTAGCPIQCDPYSFASQGFNVLSFTSPPNFLRGAGGSYPSVLPKLNVPQLIAFLKSLDGKPNPQFCTDPTVPCTQPFDFSQTLPQANPFNSYADDPRSLGDELIAERTAALCKTTEAAWCRDGGEAPVYIIGTEVPVPGGAHEDVQELAVTTPAAAHATIEAHRRAFVRYGIESAWSRVVGLVVQPGVEFDHHKVIDYVPSKAVELSRSIEPMEGVVFEAHSTDYQTGGALQALVRDHFAILKVGPGLTFALREVFWALSDIASELGATAEASVKEIMLAEMKRDPRYWKSYYTNLEQQEFDLQFSLSDRSRYYWSTPVVARACSQLLESLESRGIPLTLISQYLPPQYAAIREDRLENDARELVIHGVDHVLRHYDRACRPDDRATHAGV